MASDIISASYTAHVVFMKGANPTQSSSATPTKTPLPSRSQLLLQALEWTLSPEKATDLKK
jgi:hypothetical protein